MITDLKQLVVQDTSLSGEDRVYIQHGPDFTKLKQVSITYNELTQEEKVIWDDFINLMKSKG